MAQLEVGGPELAKADSTELAGVWGEVFAAPPWSERPEVIAIAPTEERIDMFADGHIGRRGMWWPEYLRAKVGDQIVDNWVIGQFELIEMALRVRARGVGTGRRLIEHLLATRHESRVALQTRDEDRPARRLHESLGFVPLSDLDGDVLLGRELPL